MPAVATAALSELVGLAAYRYAEIDDLAITADLAEKVEYADPEADVKEGSD